MKVSKLTPDANNVFRHRLKNGATLLIKEDRSNPVVSLNLWVEAGSVDERPDERGMAHLIEHMIFKGTTKRAVGQISREVEAAGGYLNAFTSFEYTCFYVVLPSAQIEKALDVEFDAYLHSTFDAGELAKEKEVVYEEMRMRRDDPWSWSWEILFRVLFQKNPYHWPVIGDMDILGKVPKETLLKYYKKHYVPANTVIAVVGNVSAPKIVQWVQKNFESFKSPKPPKRAFKSDAEPKALKLHLESGEVQQVYLSLGYQTVALTHPDAAAIEVLDSILGEGPASRLNLEIREKTQSADEASTEHFSGKFGGAFLFQALTDVKRADRFVVEAMREVKKLMTSGVEASELAKIKNKIKAYKVFEKQSVDGQAKTLGFWELQGDYHLEDKFLKALDAVTSADLQRVAEKYLKPSRATLVLYHPKSQKMNAKASHWQKLLESGLNAPVPTVVAVGTTKSRRSPSGLAAGVKNGYLKKYKLKNGSTLMVKERKNLPIVSLGMFVNGGYVNEKPKQQGITNLMTKCVLKGTRQKNNEVFSKEIESLAAHLDPQMDKDYWGVSLETLKDNFKPAIDLFMEAAFEPLFSEAEVNKEKKLQIAAIKRLKDDPSEYAMLQSDVITFAGTPYAHMPSGTVESVSKLTYQHLRHWHALHLSPKNTTWIAVGDVNGEELKALLDSKIPDTHAKPIAKNKKTSFKPFQAVELNLPSESKQANIVLGFRAPVFGTPEYFGFRVLNTILNGMGGRLFVELREKKSLAYSVYASHDAGAAAGVYQMYIGCAPEKADKAKKELLKVIADMAKNKVSDEELQRAKTYMIGLQQVSLQANRTQLLSYLKHELVGQGAAVLDQFPSLIQKVTSADVQKLAQKYLTTPNKTWVSLTPKK